MTITLILPMTAFALAASISPGPVNLVCLSSGTRYPLSKGLMFVTGATLGFIVLFVAIGLGVYAGVYLRRYIQRPMVLVILNRVLALLLVASCIYLMIG